MAVSRAPTASITIHNLDDRVKARLRVRAAQNGRSMEAEARSILSDTLTPEAGESLNFFQAIRRHVEPLGGIELEEHPSVVIGEPPTGVSALSGYDRLTRPGGITCAKGHKDPASAASSPMHKS